MNLWRTRSDAAWGAPVGLRNARHWSDCPAIDANAIPGAAGLRCNQATCALVCQPGHVSKGRRRVRCRKNKRKNVWFWKNTLGSCKTCDVETPTSNDPLMTTTCKVNEGKETKLFNEILVIQIKGLTADSANSLALLTTLLLAPKKDS